MECSIKHIAANPPPSHLSFLLLRHSSSPGPSSGSPARLEARGKKSRGVSGLGGKGDLSSCHFLCDYFKIYRIGWAFLSEPGFGRAVFSEVLFTLQLLARACRTHLPKPKAAQPCPAEGQIQSCCGRREGLTTLPAGGQALILFQK